MEAVNDIRNRYGSAALATAVVVGLLLVLLGYKALAKGFVLGTLFSIVNFVLIAQFLPRSLGRGRRQAVAFSLVSIGLRYCLLAVPLVVSLRSDAFHTAGVVPGLLMVQATIFADHFYRVLADRRKPSA